LLCTKSNRIPITINVCYNYSKTGLLGESWQFDFENYSINTISGCCVSNWMGKQDCYQEMSIDEANNKFNFDIPTTETRTLYVNSITCSFILAGTNTFGNYELQDRNRNKVFFNNTTLQRIVTNGGEWINYQYTNDQITITNSDYEKIEIYISTGLATKVKYYNELKDIIFTYYDNNRLCQIDYYTKSDIVAMEYLSNSIGFDYAASQHEGKLSTIEDNITKQGDSIQYIDAIESTPDILRIESYTKNSQNLRIITGYLEVSFYYQRTSVTNHLGETATYHHNVDGQFNLITRSDNSFTSRVHLKNDNGEIANVSGQSNSQLSSYHLLENYSFDQELALQNADGVGWISNHSNTCDISISPFGINGGNCLKISCDGNATINVQQTIEEGLTNGSHSIHGFIKYASLLNNEIEEGDIVIRLSINYDGLLSPIVYSLNHFSGNSDWIPFLFENVTFVTSNNKTLKIEFIVNSIPCQVWIDEITTSLDMESRRYNFVKNGQFEKKDNDNIPLLWDLVNMDYTDIYNEDVGKLSSHIPVQHEYSLNQSFSYKLREIHQHISVKGNAKDELLLICWAALHITSNTKAEMYLDIHYTTDDTTIRYHFDFDYRQEVEDCQVLIRSVVATKPYDQVTIGIIYDGINYAAFSDVQLYKDGYGVSYEYDELNRPINIQSGNSVTEIEYDEKGNMTLMSDEMGNEISYTYDTQNRILSINENNYSVIENEYDSTNNTISSTLTTSQNAVASKTSLFSNKTEDTIQNNNDVNHLISEINSDGTSLFYDYHKSKNSQSVLSPNGSISRLKYDAHGLLTQQRTLSNNDNEIINYEYYDSYNVRNLHKGDGSTYNFVYNEIGNLIEINLDGNMITKFEYNHLNNNINSGLISKKSYGTDNNAYSFEYTSKNLLKKVKFQSEDRVSYEYNSLKLKLPIC
jgi:YD repeat-containing protein